MGPDEARRRAHGILLHGKQQGSARRPSRSLARRHVSEVFRDRLSRVRRRRRWLMTTSRRLGGMCAAALVAAIAVQGRAAGTNDGQWRMYSADNASTKYSPLDQ